LIETEHPDLWFCDETSFWGDPAPYLVWARKGSQPTVPYSGKHYRTSVVGAVRPQDGEFVALLITVGNSQLFQIFLDELNRQINPAKRNILILDNASFHKAKTLNWGKIQPLYLPTYSPEFNPIEELWLVIKTTYFNQWMARSQQGLEDKVVETLIIYQNNPESVKSICAMSAYL
jgi:transposase